MNELKEVYFSHLSGYVRHITAFARGIPQFASLCLDDQHTLIKAGMSLSVLYKRMSTPSNA